MPMQVLVKAEDALDGVERELAENLENATAKELALRVAATTKEAVTLTPYVLKDGSYVLDHAGAEIVKLGEDVEAEAETVAEDASKLTGPELDKLAEKLGIADWKKSAKVAEKRAAITAAQQS